MERSCMCCQEYGEIEATVILFCPNSDKMQNIFKKVRNKFLLNQKKNGFLKKWIFKKIDWNQSAATMYVSLVY